MLVGFRQFNNNNRWVIWILSTERGEETFMGNHMCTVLVWGDSFIVLLMYFIMNQNSLELSWIATRQQTPHLNQIQVFEHHGCSQGVKQNESDAAGSFTAALKHSCMRWESKITPSICETDKNHSWNHLLTLHFLCRHDAFQWDY